MYEKKIVKKKIGGTNKIKGAQLYQISSSMGPYLMDGEITG